MVVEVEVYHTTDITVQSSSDHLQGMQVNPSIAIVVFASMFCWQASDLRQSGWLGKLFGNECNDVATAISFNN
jgi:hypothetical protein